MREGNYDEYNRFDNSTVKTVRKLVTQQLDCAAILDFTYEVTVYIVIIFLGNSN